MKLWYEEYFDPYERNPCPEEITWAYRQMVDWDRIFDNIWAKMVDSNKDTGVH